MKMFWLNFPTRMADNENIKATAPEHVSDDDPKVEEAKDLSSHEDSEEMTSPKQEVFAINT